MEKLTALLCNLCFLPENQELIQKHEIYSLSLELSKKYANHDAISKNFFAQIM